MAAAKPGDTVALDYRSLGKGFAKGKKPRIANISALAAEAGRLWSASDEGATIERLVAVGPPATASRYEVAGSFALGELFEGWGAPDSDHEADLEALCWDAAQRRLWLTGSHCWSLGQHGDAATFRDDARQRSRRRMRTLLGFVDVDADGNPVHGRCLPTGEDEGGLLAAIARLGDACLTDALAKLSKQGGLDIEGLAVWGRTLLVGLRGPVCQGDAIVLRANVDIAETALAITEPLSVIRLGLGGLGVRDLLARGPDLLVLAGPMGEPLEAGDRMFAVHEWKDAADAAAAGTDMHVTLGAATRLADLTGAVAGGPEKPEGMTLVLGRRLIIARDGRPAADGMLACETYDLL